MKDELLKLKKQFIDEIASVTTLEDLALIKSKYIGKKSRITEVMASMKNLPIEEKREIGTMCNKLKNEITQMVKEKNDELISKIAIYLGKESLINKPNKKTLNKV